MHCRRLSSEVRCYSSCCCRGVGLGCCLSGDTGACPSTSPDTCLLARACAAKPPLGPTSCCFASLSASLGCTAAANATEPAPDMLVMTHFASATGGRGTGMAGMGSRSGCEGHAASAEWLCAGAAAAACSTAAETCRHSEKSVMPCRPHRQRLLSSQQTSVLSVQCIEISTASSGLLGAQQVRLSPPKLQISSSAECHGRPACSHPL